MAKDVSKWPKAAIQIGRNKNPITTQRVPVTREPQTAERINYMQLKACWRLKRVQTADPYGWHQLSHEELENVRSKLAEFESMTWNEIFVQSKKQNHSIPVAELRCQQAQRWLRENMPDQSELWTIRFSNLQRVWGVFAEGAYLIIFWDPNHLIMPSRR